MQTLVVFLLLAVVVGHTRIGPRTRYRPHVVLVASGLLAASFYSLRFVL